jgi:tripartite-type tricarboxylate transporter receptor subunit TctC
MKKVLAALAVGLWLTQAAGAQEANFPNRPVQVIIPWAPGGNVDAIGRAVSGALSDALSAPFVVMNRDGAAGLIGTQALATARADGYTLGFGPTTPITNALHTLRNRPYGLDSFDYVCQIFQNMFAVTVRTDSPFRALPELVASLRERPGTLSYGHLGVGSLSHLSMAKLMREQSLVAQDVPYRGDAALLPDLIGGRLDFGVTSVGGMVGKPVRLLGVFSDRRHPSFPDVMTMTEQGLPTLQPAMNGIVAPRGLPEAVLVRLEQGCRQVAQSPALAQAMRRLNEEVVYLDRAEFTRRTVADFAEKAELVQQLGLQTQ